MASRPAPRRTRSSRPPADQDDAGAWVVAGALTAIAGYFAWEHRESIAVDLKGLQAGFSHWLASVRGEMAHGGASAPALPEPGSASGPPRETPKNRTWTVVTNDPAALMAFATQAGVSAMDIPALQAANPGKDLSKVQPGEVLHIPDSWPDRPALYNHAGAGGGATMEVKLPPAAPSLPEAPAPSTVPAPPSPTPPTANPPPALARAVITPRTKDATRPPKIQALAARIKALWPSMPGVSGEISPAALEILLAHAGHETRWGGWTGDMAGSENLGAYQCGGKQESTGYYKCVNHVDSRPNPDGTQTQYTTTYRYYTGGPTPDGVNRSAADGAAWDFLNSIVSPQKFNMAAALATGDVLEYVRLGYNHHYFESFNLTKAGLDAYAGSIAELVRRGVDIHRKGETPEMVAGRIALYAHTIADYLPDVMAALGETTLAAFVPADVVGFKPTYVAASVTAPGVQSAPVAGDLGALPVRMRRAVSHACDCEEHGPSIGFGSLPLSLRSRGVRHEVDDSVDAMVRNPNALRQLLIASGLIYDEAT
jgi:hypothetical protein